MVLAIAACLAEAVKLAVAISVTSLKEYVMILSESIYFRKHKINLIHLECVQEVQGHVHFRQCVDNLTSHVNALHLYNEAHNIPALLKWLA